MSLRLAFMGVTTAGSQIMRLFPVWAELLGLEAEIVGRDLPLDGSPEIYRSAVLELRHDEDAAGALVTTHKVAIHRHCSDLFEELDRWARLCGEISCISRRHGSLIGYAKDPITSARALAAFIGPGHWHEHPKAEVLCLGAGGAGTAIVAHLLTRADPPARVVVTSRRRAPLDSLRSIAEQLGGAERLEGHTVDGQADSDALLASMAPGSLIVNATGAGKDRPGSPLSDAATFPHEAIAWDLNYRGDLRFIVQARSQLPAEHVHDGWRYFIHGWTEVIAEVFHVDLTVALLERLSQAAEPFRPRGIP